jgi:hypothetical protein
MKKIAIHQPNFLPWMGFFEKARISDTFIFLDHVPYSKGSFTNRVKYFCKSSQKVKWLTLPVKGAALGTPINKIELSSAIGWESKIIHTITQNISSPFATTIADIIKNRRTTKLADLNIVLIKSMMKNMGITSECMRSSQLSLDESNSQEVLKIAMECKASKYICGLGGRNYLDVGAFAQKEIEVEMLDFMQLVKESGKMPAGQEALTAMYAL